VEIRARVTSRSGEHDVALSTNGSSHALPIPPKESGQGFSVNGGELLALAVATCFCNDLYREAAPCAVPIHRLEVEVEALFGGVGEPARQIRYRVIISADAPEETVRGLVAHTDRVAEIHNTLRLGMPVQLESVTIESGAASRTA
jgi:organic hydroperoxide reductase OsmC/OhrA